MTLQTSELKTTITYEFPDGIQPSAHISIPFDYITQDDVKVNFNGRLLNSNEYEFEAKGTIHLNFGSPERTTITIYRNTPITETSKTKALVYAILEAKDEVATVKPMLAAVDVSLGKLEEKNIDTYTDLKEEIDAVKVAFEHETIGIQIALADYERHFRQTLSQIAKENVEFQKDTENKIYWLQTDTQENKNNWKPSFDTLSRDLNTVTRLNIDDIGELKEQVKTLTEKLKTLEGSTCHCHAEPPKEPQDDTRIKAIEKNLKETMSALNIETQVRRREDAQIKTLLKHLLAKFDRLEDFVAGNDPDLGSTVLDELRSEMKRQDDTLGRTHLESLVRYGEVCDKLADLGRTDLENIARLARLKEALADRN